MIVDYWEPNGLLVTRYLETISGEDLVSSALSKSGDDRFDQVKYIISDWSEAQEVKIGTQDVELLVACLRPISAIIPNAKNASLVNRDTTGNAVLAWYKFLTEDLSWDVEIFHQRQELMAWCTDYEQFMKDHATFREGKYFWT